MERLLSFCKDFFRSNVSNSKHKCQRVAPGGVLRNLSDGDDRMEPKFKTQKNPKIFQRNPKTSLVKKLTPKKSHADFVAIPERDIAITQRKTEVERSCLFIHYTN